MNLKFLSTVLVLLTLSSCNFTVAMNHSDYGTASDVIDDTDSVTPSTNLSIPVKAV